MRTFNIRTCGAYSYRYYLKGKTAVLQAVCEVLSSVAQDGNLLLFCWVLSKRREQLTQ
jgi:hypothetical protein